MKVQTASIFPIVLVSLALTLPADAYVRTQTCKDWLVPGSDRLACAEGQTPISLYWSTNCVSIYANEDGTQDVSDQNDVYDAIRASVETWTAVECSDMVLIYAGLTDEDRVGYSSCENTTNANIIVWRTSSWNHASGALALTSVVYEMQTGRIVDADIELNDFENFTFTATDDPALVDIDIQNTVTHELGHVIGFDHPPVPEATMFATAPSGETSKRSLAQDDIDAICDTYPASDNPTVCGTPAEYFTAPEIGPGDTCPVEDTCGCHQDDPAVSGLALFVLGLVTVRWLWRRRVVV